MAYKSGGTEHIKDDNTVVGFQNVTVTNFYTIDPTPASQGSTSGYTTGGSPSPNINFLNVIDKFPFSSDANATDVGDLTQGRTSLTGTSSSSHAYASGGWLSTRSNVIDRFPFSSDTNATDVGDLINLSNTGAPAMSYDHGYVSGGFTGPPFLLINVIQRFPFANATTNATDVGDLTEGTGTSAGHSDNSYGYVSGGRTPPTGSEFGTYPVRNQIDRFPFATATTNSADVGDLASRVLDNKGHSSATHGYSTGGTNDPTDAGTTYNYIQKFSFASSSSASTVASLISALKKHAGISSTDNGYAVGGNAGNGAPSAGGNVIQKFPFSSDAAATDVGDLTVSRVQSANNEV